MTSGRTRQTAGTSHHGERGESPDREAGVAARTPQPGEVTELLSRWARRDPTAAGELMPLVYGELRRIASGFLGRERPEHTLQATAVVHEAFIRLVEGSGLDVASRTQFVGVAARVMRQVLVDHGRSRNAEKRGGDRYRVTLAEAAAIATPTKVDVLDLHQALQRLEKRDRQMAEVVELRFFGGLTIEEIAGLLEVSQASVSRLWRRAKAWLYQALVEEAEG